MSKPSKSWVFTHNNWTPADRQRYLDFEKSYMVLGEETSETGTPHLQGFITFKRAYRLTQLTKLIPGAHWEIALTQDAGNYCMKESYTIQDFRTQGKRTDIDIVREMVNQGAPMSAIVDECTGYQTIRFAEKLKEHTIQRRDWVPEVLWFWGPTGSGKTRAAYEILGPDCWISGRNLKWWQGYDGQPHVLIDDFRPDFCSFHELLRILDRYPYTVEVKGGSRPLLARKIIITAPLSPEDTFRFHTLEDLLQLVRRIGQTVKFPVDQ